MSERHDVRRKVVAVSEPLTPERLAELRRIAEAATPGPWAVNPFKATVDEMPSMLPICGLLWPTDQRTEEQTLANATHIATFDPTTVIAILDEIERLRRLQQKVQSAAVLAVAAEQVLKAWVMGDYLAPFMDDLENALLDFDGPVASEAVWEDIEPDGEEGGGGE